MKKLILISAALLTMAGCQPYKTGQLAPDNGIPVINNAAEAKENLYGPTDRWWESFNDKTLNALVEEALAGNLDIKIAAERVIQARQIAIRSGAGRFPSASLNASGGRVRQSSSLGAFESDAFSASASASYELDLWGKHGSAARAASLDAEASAMHLRSIQMSISAETAEYYYSAIHQNALLELTDLTTSSISQMLESVELRYNAGLVQSLDVYQARQNLSSASTERPRYEANREAAISALSNIMGKGFADRADIKTAHLTTPPLMVKNIPSDLLKRRPDVQEALLALGASDERVANAVAKRFPSFSLSASYGGSSDELSTILDSPNIFWNLLMNISMPIFDAGARKADAKRAEAVLRERLAIYHKVVLNSMREVHVALIKNMYTQEQVRLLELSVQASQNTLRAAEEQYLLGVADYLDVLSAQQQLYSSRLGLLNTRRSLISNRIELARTLGGRWMDEKMQITLTDEDNK
jgi:NodT family efflux transporter outer membrane factor (OMF) lipoprotein